MTVDTIGDHHEGGNKPRDDQASFDAVAAHGYSYILGATRWQNYRIPDDPRPHPYHDFSVEGFNGVVMGVCSLGNYNDVAPTARQLEMRREIGAHARSKGYVVAQPIVLSHRQFPPPNATQCAGSHIGPAIPAKGLAGDNLMWMQIVAEYHGGTAPPPPPADAVFIPSMGAAMIALTSTGKGYWIVDSTGAVFAYGDAKYYGGANNMKLNAPIIGLSPTPDDGGYILLGRDGGTFPYGNAPKNLGNPVGKVH